MRSLFGRRPGISRARVESSFSFAGTDMSIVRIGLAETKNFSEGYDAIFGKKKSPSQASAAAKAAPAKKPAVKKNKKKN